MSLSPGITTAILKVRDPVIVDRLIFAERETYKGNKFLKNWLINFIGNPCNDHSSTRS